MLARWLGKVWNRRQDNRRVSLHIPVVASDPKGNRHEGLSEDVSASGVRLRFEKVGLAQVMGHREDVPMEIRISQDADPIQAQAQLIWAYNTAKGGSVSGWRFVQFQGNCQTRLRAFLSEYGE